MPRIILGSNSPPRRTEVLVQKLAEELTSPGVGPQPLIVEQLLPVTNSRHVRVVWDQWANLSEEERAAIIIQAYEKVEGSGAADNITIALGMRPREAAILGVVPYLVQPLHPHLMERTDYRVALSKEVRHTVMGEGAKELRYPTEGEANRAVERLKQINPDTSWVVHEEVDEDED